MSGEPPTMTADYAYLANGLVSTVSYGNGTSTVYTYDPAQRVIGIDHRDMGGGTILMLQYGYTDNDLVASITECTTSDCVPGSVSAAVAFDYDNRGRLMHEVRDDVADPTRSYNIANEYDPGGNRTKKIEYLAPGLRHETTYTYDIEDPGLYGSANNRLMKSIQEEVTPAAMFMSSSTASSTPTAAASGGAEEDPERAQYGSVKGSPKETGLSSRLTGPADAGAGSDAFFNETRTLLETKWYYYSEELERDEGNVRRVVTRKENLDPGEPAYAATRLVYARNERVVTYATGETWDYDGDPATTPPINYAVTYGRAFRYDGARQRYLNRELALTFIPGPPVPYWQKDVVSQAWSDYGERSERERAATG